MALIKLSSVGITNISGKAGGSVYAHNRGGSYVRNFAVPSNPQTEAQMAARAIFGSFASQWRTLSAAVQKAWREAAPSFPVKNPFGDERILSGNALFQQLNRNLSVINAPAITNPPIPSGLSGISGLDLVASNNAAGDAPILSIQASFASADLDDVRVAVYATPLLSAGINSASNRLRLIRATPASSVQSTLDLVADYNAVFGSITPGAAIIVKVVPISYSTGERAAAFTDRVIVADTTV